MILGLDPGRVAVMGIVNVTPDSFSDGGTLSGPNAARARAVAMVEAGADLLDIGGESTRPGAALVPVAEEIARVVPAIEAIRAAGIAAPISVDTRKAEVARAALAAGADMVNDVSALTWDADMADAVAEAGCPICLMHAKGTPQTMQADPTYEDVTAEVRDYLADAAARAQAAGIARERIVLDPGIGFGKTLEHNLTLLRDLRSFAELGYPLLLGASRKRFVGTITRVERADARLAGSLAVALHAAAHGATILRVHDVAETAQALAMARAIGESR